MMIMWGKIKSLLLIIGLCISLSLSQSSCSFTIPKESSIENEFKARIVGCPSLLTLTLNGYYNRSSAMDGGGKSLILQGISNASLNSSSLEFKNFSSLQIKGISFLNSSQLILSNINKATVNMCSFRSSNNSFVRAISTNGVSLYLNSTQIFGYKSTSGPAVLSQGDLFVFNTTVENCVGTQQGAIYSTGTTQINSSTFSSNQCELCSGGAVSAISKLIIQSSKFSLNQAQNQGGAIKCNSTLYVMSSIFDKNVASKDRGGAIASEGTVDIRSTSFTDNRADLLSGGAVWTRSGNNLLMNNSFVRNRSPVHWGGAFSIYDTYSESDLKFTSNIYNCVFINNSATWGGGVYADHPLSIWNSSFEGNIATTKGGGIAVVVPLNVTGSIFIRNSASIEGAVLVTFKGVYITDHYSQENNPTRNSITLIDPAPIYIKNATFNCEKIVSNASDIFIFYNNDYRLSKNRGTYTFFPFIQVTDEFFPDTEGGLYGGKLTDESAASIGRSILSVRIDGSDSTCTLQNQTLRCPVGVGNGINRNLNYCDVNLAFQSLPPYITQAYLSENNQTLIVEGQSFGRLGSNIQLVSSDNFNLCAGPVEMLVNSTKIRCNFAKSGGSTFHLNAGGLSSNYKSIPNLPLKTSQDPVLVGEIIGSSCILDDTTNGGNYYDLSPFANKGDMSVIDGMKFYQYYWNPCGMDTNYYRSYPESVHCQSQSMCKVVPNTQYSFGLGTKSSMIWARNGSNIQLVMTDPAPECELNSNLRRTFIEFFCSNETFVPQFRFIQEENCNYFFNFTAKCNSPPQDLLKAITSLINSTGTKITEDINNIVSKYFGDNSVPQVSISNMNITLTAVRISVGTTTQINLQNNQGSSNIPTSVINSSNNASFAVYYVLKNPPFAFVNSTSSRINGAQIYGLSLVDESSNEIPVENASEEISISMVLPSDFDSANNDVNCLFWDEENSSWSKRGCRVGTKTNSTVECLCTHLTNFTLGYSPILKSSAKLEESSLPVTIIVVVSILGFLVVTIGILAVLFVIRKRRIAKDTKKSIISSSLEGDIDLQIIHHDLSYIKETGNHTYGTVYIALYQGTTKVTVKSLDDERDKNKFMNEIFISKRVHHPHLIQLLGTVNVSGKLCMVIEYVEYSLTEYLRDGQTKSDFTLISLAKEVMSGLSYLHSMGIVHGSIQTDAVALTGSEQFTAKLTNLSASSLANSVAQDWDYPIRWTSPEVLKGEKASFESDVYSVGCFLWQLFNGGRIPFQDISEEKKVKEMIQRGRRLSIPQVLPEISKVMSQCWEKPDQRPDVNAIYHSLNSMLPSSKGLEGSVFLDLEKRDDAKPSNYDRL